MGCHVLELADGRAVMQCSVTGLVFGPVFAGEDRAEAFIAYALRTSGRDPRGMGPTELEREFGLWKLLNMHWPIERLAVQPMADDVKEAIRLGYLYREHTGHVRREWVRIGLTEAGRAARGEGG